MGVHVYKGTLSGGLTPICSDCMVSLCWDISLEEYEEKPDFWDEWRCKECYPHYKKNTKRGFMSEGMK